MNYESRISGTDAPHVARYTDNHDEGRGMYLFGEGAVRAVNALIFLAPHTMPFLLTGEDAELIWSGEVAAFVNNPPRFIVNVGTLMRR
jgi:hypothetical protein